MHGSDITGKMAHGEENGFLHKWCREGNYEQISQFVKINGQDFSSQLTHHQGVFGYTPLHIAANSGHLKVLDLLLHNGADVNCLSINNSTPLHLAMSGGHIDCVLLLLAYGADGSLVDDQAKTAFQTTKLRGSAFKKLLKSKGKLSSCSLR